MVEIPKPGKPARARQCTKGWRPISLISVPAKGLERLVARRLARAADEGGLFGPLQAGAVLRRSAIDLLVALVYTAEADRVS